MQSAVDALRRVPLFAPLSDEQLASVERGSEVRLQPGEYIKKAGDPPEGFYVVIEGQIEWTSKVRQQDVFVQSLVAGDFWGHELLITGKPYPVSGRALTDVSLYVLETDDFWRVLSDCPSILRNLVAILVERWGNLGEAEQQHVVAGLPKEAATRAENAQELDSLERSDLEDEVALWLEDRGVAEAWDLSPTLVGAGLDAEWLDGLEGRFSDGSVGEVVAWLASEVAGDELLREIQYASTRISELVGAVKSYSHMDKLASNEVDVHAGLNSTLIMLGHKLKKGDVEVVRDYEKDLPHVCGHAGELNQVWTNLIDNAIDAVDGQGRITVRTASENGRILVEVADDGPGIPEDMRERIFEPFYTTKDVGEGTGLGLDISYRVVVEEHKGDIRVLSEPGDTRFQVRLPVDEPGDVHGTVDRDLPMGADA